MADKGRDSAAGGRRGSSVGSTGRRGSVSNRRDSKTDRGESTGSRQDSKTGRRESTGSRRDSNAGHGESTGNRRDSNAGRGESTGNRRDSNTGRGESTGSHRESIGSDGGGRHGSMSSQKDSRRDSAGSQRDSYGPRHESTSSYKDSYTAGSQAEGAEGAEGAERVERAKGVAISVASSLVERAVNEPTAEGSKRVSEGSKRVSMLDDKGASLSAPAGDSVKELRPSSLAKALAGAVDVGRQLAPAVSQPPSRRPGSGVSVSTRLSGDSSADAMAQRAAVAEEHRVFHEVDIERQRILGVLDQLVERLEVALCLPLLVQHSGNTKRNCFLTPEETELLEACREYSMKAPPLPKDVAHRVPSLDEALAAPIDETRNSVLRSSGRLKAVRKLEEALQKKADLKHEYKPDIDDERDNENAEEGIEEHEDDAGGSMGSGGNGSQNGSSDLDIFSVGDDHPFSIGGYSSSFFDSGRTSEADKDRATIVIREMLRRRELKQQAKKKAQDVAKSLVSGAVGKATSQAESFWGPSSRLQQRAVYRFSQPGSECDPDAGHGRGDTASVHCARLDSRVAKLLDSLCGRPLLRKAVKRFLLPEISQAGRVFLEYVRGLREVAAQRLLRTPREEALREEQLRRVYARNAEAANELHKLEEQLVEARAAGDQELTQREGDVDLYEKRMERLCAKHKADMLKRENASERSMVMEWKSSQMRQMAMENELHDMEAQLKKLREKNLEDEHEMRLKRQRLERQLEAIITSYDNDMTERQAQLDKVTEDLEKERELLETLQQQMREQEEDYQRLLEERSAEEEVEFQKALYQFLINRSARVIQRTWRAYHARRMAKRKGKGKGKGKKDKGKKKKK